MPDKGQTLPEAILKFLIVSYFEKRSVRSSWTFRQQTMVSCEAFLSKFDSLKNGKKPWALVEICSFKISLKGWKHLLTRVQYCLI